MPFFDGATGPVYYRKWPSPRPVAGVVFLHGIGENTNYYHRLGAALNARGITLWALDEIGHGLSAGLRGRVENLDDLVINGQRLTDIAADDGLPLVFAGHSMGGTTAALTAIRHPNRFKGIVLSGAPLRAPSWLQSLIEAPGTSPDFSLEPDELSADPFYIDSVLNDPLVPDDAGMKHTLAYAFTSAFAELADHFSEVALPVLAVHGSADPMIPVADAYGATPQLRCENGRLQQFAKSRHDLLNDTAHAEVAEAVADFVLTVGVTGR